MGDKFYTIDTDDMEGLSTEDSIKVITPGEIYSPSDFTYSVPYYYPEHAYSSNEPAAIPIHTDHLPNPQINFAQVIKIINDGNDMSSSTSAIPEATATTAASNPYNIDIPTAMGIPIPNQIPSSSEENKSDTIDFDKPIIIKKL
jgi:hypothetical protein